jgi:nucleoside-diphosphate-sugar epimerase
VTSLPRDADAVVYLAQGRAPFPDGAPELYAINTSAVLTALDFARRTGVASFVLASSGSVYGGRPGPAGYAETEPCRPADFYARTKRHAEEIAEAFQAWIPTTVLRLFSPYGPGQMGRMISRIIEAVATGTPLAIAAEGATPRFNPVFVSDVVDVVAAVLARPIADILNVGGPAVLSLREMAVIIGEVLGRPPVFGTAVPGVPDCFGSLERLARKTGHVPATSFREGIARTISDRVLAPEARAW